MEPRLLYVPMGLRESDLNDTKANYRLHRVLCILNKPTRALTLGPLDNTVSHAGISGATE